MVNTHCVDLPDVYYERKQLFKNAVELKEEGRVLAAPQIMYLPIFLYGETTVRAVMEDPRNGMDSWMHYYNEYQPDLFWDCGAILPKTALELMDCQYARWSGRHLEGENEPFQVLDHEYMTAEEYVEFAEDPTGFMMRKVLPRHYKNLQGLEMVDFSNALYVRGLFSAIPFSLPPVKKAIETLAKTGEEMRRVGEALGELGMSAAKAGFPAAMDFAANVPFDMFNDLLRGMMNATMDMILYPDELELALEAATKIQVRHIKNKMKQKPGATVFFFLHNGTDMLMSPEQFGRFYWPGLRKCIDTVIELGGTPRIYTEGKYEMKLDYLADVPKGKVIYNLVDTDMKLAKEKLGGKACIAGGINSTMLEWGTPAQVERSVRELLDLLMPGGGYILDTSAPIDVAKPENLRALFDTAFKYGAY